MVTNNSAKIERLVKDHLHLAQLVARGFVQGKVEDTEAYSDALLGLFKAAQTYDPSNTTAFPSWAIRIIKNTITTEFRNRSRQQQIETIHEDDLSQQLKGRYYAVTTVEMSRVMMYQMLEWDCNDSCVDRENKKIANKYLDGVSMAEIGRHYGLTRERIRQRIDNLTAMLRKRHSKEIGDCISEKRTLD